MAFASKPYYWLECEDPGCLGRFPSESDDANAWDDPELLTEIAAADEDWRISSDDTHWCPIHARYWRCVDCGTNLPEPIPDPEQRRCTACTTPEEPAHAI